MIYRRKDKSSDEEQVKRLLRYHDSIAVPTDLELSALEQQIFMHLETAVSHDVPPSLIAPAWKLGPSWAMRGAMLAAFLTVTLGFLYGLGVSNQIASLNNIAVLTDETPWPSFMTASSSGGETYDVSE